MKIGVLGIGCTKFGEHWDKSISDLLTISQFQALKDAGISPEQIDSIFVGNMNSAIFSGQVHLGVIAAEMFNLNIPAYSVESACASGGVAIRNGVMAILSGMAEVVMVSGVEKMTDVTSEEVTTALMSAASEELETFGGATFPALNALVAQNYISKYGLTRKQLASVSIKNHKHGSLNPNAHFKREINLDDVLNSPIISDPFTVLDCSPVSDGAATVILCSDSFAKKINKKLVNIVASGMAVDSLSLQNRENLTSMKATRLAADQACKSADLNPKDINVVELHDAFSILEIIALEDLGFFAKGEAGKATEEGKTYFDSNFGLAVNPSGGLKAKGHPVGATGVSQVVEITKQLRGECDKNQVKDARVGLTHNMGGCGASVVVHILKKED
ncbi:TPA: thiolase domain-containing protein [Candidatus Dependentiae bacterium]|nr:MAG: Thiolase [candidate division TM6 bacterium GW2011_GWE2_31_21]KKP53751.1 MAG: Thiolase [candidate division TM6 bacterium GW2011_GWF2_33_332]HBS48495.1 thiolase domain-containing protein [Candidatus Dependentiae bacterium]HBZ73110.1 thiolase domain-containing protein [Candidatus Dependentiae bacterium]